MGDLEDSFLKKNVPGRYTSWSEENDDGLGADADNLDETGIDNDDDSEDDEYYLEGLPPLPGKDCHIEPSSAVSSNGLKKSCNTGVKGVLSDYRDAQRREKEETRTERLEEVVTRKSHNRRHHDFHKQYKVKSNSNDDDDGNGDEDHIISTTENEESEGENSKYLQHPTRTTLHPFYRKSHYPKVTPEEYVQLLDEMENNVHKNVLYMVVHLYESSIPECRQLHSVLKQMKSESITSSSQFIEVDALDANPDMDTIILPTILIYDRRGELKHNLVRFTDDLPPDYTAWELSEYFHKLGIVV